eukprot:267026-Prorocentrum_minimum.AAC.2
MQDIQIPVGPLLSRETVILLIVNPNWPKDLVVNPLPRAYGFGVDEIRVRERQEFPDRRGSLRIDEPLKFPRSLRFFRVPNLPPPTATAARIHVESGQTSLLRPTHRIRLNCALELVTEFQAMYIDIYFHENKPFMHAIGNIERNVHDTLAPPRNPTSAFGDFRSRFPYGQSIKRSNTRRVSSNREESPYP